MSLEYRWSESYFELNYLISEATALRVREFVQCHLDFDEYSVGCPNYSFAVHTLYLDSDNLALYWRALNDIEHRWQLRVRYYTTRPDAPAHLEIKHRWASGVTRHKCSVRQVAVPLVLMGHVPDWQHLASPNPSHLVAAQKFVGLLGAIKAKPKLHVAFLREAYTSDDHTVRVTMDRLIQCEPWFEVALGTHMSCPCHLFLPSVLLELSYARRFPEWFRDLVETFDLTDREADKYVDGVAAVGQQALGCYN